MISLAGFKYTHVCIHVLMYIYMEMYTNIDETLALLFSVKYDFRRGGDFFAGLIQKQMAKCMKHKKN